jgi:predicted anti-sigma-YlaC factor YlaD
MSPPRADAHPTPGEILELHFEEAGTDAAAIAEHLTRCEACRAQSDEVAWVERLVAAGDDEPPSDGLERLLARVEALPRPATARAPWRRAAAASLLAVGIGAGFIRIVGARVMESGVTGGLEPVAALSGFGLAAAVFFAAGSLATLTVAPFLILEAEAARRLRAAPR